MAASMMLFTRDLRLTDNPALAAAIAGAPQVVPAFVLDDDLLALVAGHASRLGFLHASLRAWQPARFTTPGDSTRRRCGYLAPLVDHGAAVARYRARRRG